MEGADGAGFGLLNAGEALAGRDTMVQVVSGWLLVRREKSLAGSRSASPFLREGFRLQMEQMA